MEALEKMAEYIKTHPSVTVRELTAAMGFSEHKSCYYWFNKAKFAGLKDFKRAVLASSSRFTINTFTSRGEPCATCRDSGMHMKMVPVVRVKTRNEPPSVLEEKLLLQLPDSISMRTFAVRLEEDGSGTWIIVDPDEKEKDTCLVLVWLNDDRLALCRSVSFGITQKKYVSLAGNEIQEPEMLGVVKATLTYL
jgi:hypothetical protein